MPIATTVGRMLLADALPPDLQDHGVLDKKGLSDLLRRLAESHPEQYREVSHRLSTLGHRAAQEAGGYTFGLRHLRKSKAALQTRQTIEQGLRQVFATPGLTSAQRRERIVALTADEMGKQQKAVLDESLAEGNPLAYQVLSGSRGNAMNLSSLRGSDLLYVDHRGNQIPFPVLRSYSEGLTPAEYWAGTYGARKGVIDVKQGTAKAGYFGKQLNQIAHRLLVTDLDAQDDHERPATVRGLPVATMDPDNSGALLAKEAGPYARNTVLTAGVQSHLSRLGHDRILVRSPIVNGSPEGGVYARDVGIRERGVLPGRGELVGMTAAQALAEPVAQGTLSSKHSGGVAGAAKAVSGFTAIDQLIQVPQSFQGGATHAETDGVVQRIEAAPAGGQYVTVDSTRHHVPEGVPLRVKRGDTVEAGDSLSEGEPNPAQITAAKGIGEGRKYFTESMCKVMKEAGLRVHRRNVELIARGLINHVRATDEVGDHVPGDIIPYSTLEHAYEPRAGFVSSTPAKAVGNYLERPYLHYTIGTKVRPSVVKELAHFGVDSIDTHREPPPFEAHMVRGASNLQHDPDWMTRMYGSGLKKSLLGSVHRGGTSDELGTSFVPGLARAVDFGRQGLVRTPEKGHHPGTIKAAEEPGIPGLPKLSQPLAPKAPGTPMAAPKPPAPLTPPPAPELPRPSSNPGDFIQHFQTLLGGRPAANRGPVAGYDEHGNFDFNEIARSARMAPPPPVPQVEPERLPMAGETPNPVYANGTEGLNWLRGMASDMGGWANNVGAVPGLFNGNYGALGQTLSRIPGAGWMLGMPAQSGAKSVGLIAKTSPTLGMARKAIAPVALGIDAYQTAKPVLQGQSESLADETAGELRDLATGKGGIMTPFKALNHVYSPFRNANLIVQGGKQTADTALLAGGEASRGAELAAQSADASRQNPAMVDPLANDARQYKSWGDAAGNMRNDVTAPLQAAVEAVPEAGNVAGAGLAADRHGADLDQRLLDLKRQRVAPWLGRPSWALTDMQRQEIDHYRQLEQNQQRFVPATGTFARSMMNMIPGAWALGR